MPDELLKRVREEFYGRNFDTRTLRDKACADIAAFVQEERRQAKIETLEALKEDITPGIDACRQIEGRLAELRKEAEDAQS